VITLAAVCCGSMPAGLRCAGCRWAFHAPRRRVRVTEAQVLGDVETPSHEAAEAAAGRQFELTDEQRSRLVVQERG
jgi:hypothetical protein